MKDRFPKVGLGVFVFKSGKFVMGLRKGAHGEGSWSVPGGHLEFGEELEEGAEREAFEETGLKIKDIRVVGVTNDIFTDKDEGKHYITIWFLSNWADGEARVAEPDKFLDVGWHDFESLPENLFLPWRQLLKSDFIQIIKRELTKTK